MQLTQIGEGECFQVHAICMPHDICMAHAIAICGTIVSMQRMSILSTVGSCSKTIAIVASITIPPWTGTSLLSIALPTFSIPAIRNVSGIAASRTACMLMAPSC